MQTNYSEIASITIGLTLIFIIMVVIIIVIIFIMQIRLRKKQTESFKNILIAQEQERERIAKDMHDQVGPLLSKLKLSFDSIDTENIHREWQSFKLSSQKIINATISGIRNTSFDLMPRMLRTKGLPNAVEDFCEMMSRGLPVQIFFSSQSYSAQISQQSELNIFRIMQEIINNSIKYSRAKKINVSIKGTENTLEIFISDDGIGFDFEKTKKEKNRKLGLKNIESRTLLLNGEIKFKSKANIETSYLITFKNNTLK